VKALLFISGGQAVHLPTEEDFIRVNLCYPWLRIFCFSVFFSVFGGLFFLLKKLCGTLC